MLKPIQLAAALLSLVTLGCASAQTMGGATGSGAHSPPPTSGCGATTWPKPASESTQKYTIDVGGKLREYVVGIPTDYDPNKSYPLVFAWPGLGGTAEVLAQGGTHAGDLHAGYYGLRDASTQAGTPMLFVAGQGLPTAGNDGGTDHGWRNTDGEDVFYTKAVVAWMKARYCVDRDRVFSVGFSFGGAMSNLIGCAMGDVFRAIASFSGAGPAGLGGGLGSKPTCTGQVAAFLGHGISDPAVAVDSGRASRDFWLAANHCASTSMAVEPSPCVAYDGCDSGYPVVWCEFAGAHEVKSLETTGAWVFFQRFLPRHPAVGLSGGRP